MAAFLSDHSLVLNDKLVSLTLHTLPLGFYGGRVDIEQMRDPRLEPLSRPLFWELAATCKHKVFVTFFFLVQSTNHSLCHTFLAEPTMKVCSLGIWKGCRQCCYSIYLSSGLLQSNDVGLHSKKSSSSASSIPVHTKLNYLTLWWFSLAPPSKRL